MNRAVKLSNLNVEATDKISVLLRDTVLLLCRNGFNFHMDIKVQGLIAITLDEKEVFLIKFDEATCKAPLDPRENSSNHEVHHPKVGPLSKKCGRGRRSRPGSNRAPFESPAGSKEDVEILEDATKEAEEAPDEPEAESNPDGRSIADYGSLQNPEPEDGHFHPPLDEKRQIVTQKGDNYQNLVGGISSTVSVKEESNLIEFGFTAFEEGDSIDNLTLSGHLPLFDGGVEAVGGGSNMTGGGNNMLWSLPLGNVSGRGRRARRSGQKMYSCEHPGCGLSFYRSYTLYRHQRLKHGQRLVPPVNQQAKNVEFRCPVEGCGCVFVRASMLEKHKKEVHHQQDNAQLVGPENFLSKNDLDRYDENDLLFEGMDYGLLSR